MRRIILFSLMIIIILTTTACSSFDVLLGTEPQETIIRAELPDLEHMPQWPTEAPPTETEVPTTVATETQETETIYQQPELDIEQMVQSLIEVYPQYFELDDSNGLVIYVWKNYEDLIMCVPTQKTEELADFNEIMIEPSLALSELNMVLTYCEYNKENINICPINLNEDETVSVYTTLNIVLEEDEDIPPTT